MRRYHYSVIIEQDEDGRYIASCPAFGGCHSQGDTYEDALNNIKEAIELNIEARKQLNEPIATDTHIAC